MLSTTKTKSRDLIAFIPAMLLVIAILVIVSGCAPQPLNQNSALQIPITGGYSTLDQLGMSRRAMDAYGARLSGLASQQLGISQRAANAYSARLTGLVGQQLGMSRRAANAYSARLTGLASQQLGMSRRAANAYSARLTGPAGQQLGMSRRAMDAETARWEAMARYYQSLASK